MNVTHNRAIANDELCSQDRSIVEDRRVKVRGKVRGASLRGGKMRGISARRWVICEAGICEAQWATGAAGVVIGCEPLKRN